MGIVAILLLFVGLALAWMGGNEMHTYWQAERKDRKTVDLLIGLAFFLIGGGLITLTKWIYQ